MRKLIQSIRHSLCPLRTYAFSNIAVGTHPGRLTRTLATTLSERYTLVKSDTLPNTVKPCQPSERPLGIATDTGTQDEAININLLGSGGQTQLLVAATALSEGDLLYVGSDGRVQLLPNTPGTYYEVGTALTPAAGAGQLVEVATRAPLRVINVAAFEGNAANDLAKLAVALEQRPDKIRLLAL